MFSFNSIDSIMLDSQTSQFDPTRLSGEDTSHTNLADNFLCPQCHPKNPRVHRGVVPYLCRIELWVYRLDWIPIVVRANNEIRVLHRAHHDCRQVNHLILRVASMWRPKIAFGVLLRSDLRFQGTLFLQEKLRRM